MEQGFALIMHFTIRRTNVATALVIAATTNIARATRRIAPMRFLNQKELFVVQHRRITCVTPMTIALEHAQTAPMSGKHSMKSVALPTDLATSTIIVQVTTKIARCLTK
jgi:hypothetical protein